MENIGVVADNMASEVVETIKEEMDLNKDGKVTIDEVIYSIKSIPTLIGVVVAILTGVLLSYLRDGLMTGVWDASRMLDTIQYLIPSLIIIYASKIIIQRIEDSSRDNEDKKDKEIAELKKELKEARSEIVNLNNRLILDKQKYELEISQLNATIKTKNLEIDWLRNGYKPPGESEI